ncbi:hypothetical protein FUAX_00230 [Fulvitalea axinellae]|uniref:Transposase IS30-like HTH domain-containing protein n=1 Tax=Fulvitalea axinellae TaxID=1182444 RepID=A0AAU9CFS5_9BACT|nr:hypothetical protein FUAX_00230 [Fulvitalea axinellae]
MPSVYRHLNYSQRKAISHLRRMGYTLQEIARTIRVSASTVSRELRRNSFNGIYDAHKAHQFYKGRKILTATRHRFPTATPNASIRFDQPRYYDRLLKAWHSDYGKYLRYFSMPSSLPVEFRNPSLYKLKEKPQQPGNDIPIMLLARIKKDESTLGPMEAHKRCTETLLEIIKKINGHPPASTVLAR